MKLNRLTERVWIYPFEAARDRPNLGYIRGDRWSLAVDAGHSADHVRDFYGALEEAGLPRPRLTVLTHWHWDHTFGMNAIHGLSVANGKTNRYLADFRRRLAGEGTGFFFGMDASIRREYAGGRPVVVTLADLVFGGELLLDAGNCPMRLFQAEAPHTDDSTLIEAPGERVLFVGDATSGVFPEWTMDLDRAEKLSGTIRRVDPEICVHGHLPPLSAEDVIDIMLEGE